MEVQITDFIVQAQIVKKEEDQDQDLIQQNQNRINDPTETTSVESSGSSGQQVSWWVNK